MSDMHAVSGGATPELERLVDDLKAEIALGHVGDDVSSVLRQRIADAGLTVPDEDIETIASDIEVESSR
jgi:hypothetical protein